MLNKLKTLVDEEVFDKIMKNLKHPEELSKMVPTASAIINLGFVWDATEEGQEYWETIWEDILLKEALVDSTECVKEIIKQYD